MGENEIEDQMKDDADLVGLPEDVRTDVSEVGSGSCLGAGRPPDSLRQYEEPELLPPDS